MANITKLKSGSYRVRQMYHGKSYAFTIPAKKVPRRKADIERMMMEYIAEHEGLDPETGDKTFKATAEDYIKSKDAILSPATIVGYESILRCMPEDFVKRPISGITQSDIQILLNRYAADHSPKSVRNLSGFVSAIIKTVKPQFISTATLPQKEADKFYLPEREDVRRILEYAKGSKYEVPLLLACFGLRRSEVCALTLEDLNGNRLTINKALVKDRNKEWVLKTTKTTSSARQIVISDYLADLIRQQGYIYQGDAGEINEYLHKAQKALEIPSFNLHKLRAFFASVAREYMPDQYVERAGGWTRGSQIMRKVYSYTEQKRSEEVMEEFAQQMSGILDTRDKPCQNS